MRLAPIYCIMSRQLYSLIGVIHVVFQSYKHGTMVLGPGDIYTFLATTEETDGAYFVLEGMVPPDAGPPPHIHHDQDESFYVVEGQLDIMVGGEVREAKAGRFCACFQGDAP